LDRQNSKALFRRALGKALPINSGVEDMKSSVVDLKKVIAIKPGF
jgi:hypothetical protein